MKRFIPLFAVLTLSCHAADIVPSSKLPPSRMREVGTQYGLGVTGGIPARTTTTIDLTASPYNFSPGGNITTALTTALNSIASSGSETAILIPAGSHTMTSCSLPSSGGGIEPWGDYTIRGAGSGSTTITCTGGFVGGNTPVYTDDTEDVISGLTQDSNAVVVADASGFSANHFARILFPNDYRIPVMRPDNINQYCRSIDVYVTNVNTTTDTITFTPPLPQDFSDLETLTGIPVQIKAETSRGATRRVGIEGMTIVTSGGSPIEMNGTYECWLKDVKFSGQSNHGCVLTVAVKFEMRKCWVGESSGGGGSNKSGILLSYATNALFEDNILELNQPCIELWLGNTNVVFAYNYLPIGVNGLTFNIHNNHNNHILVEGNILPGVQVDTYFGSASEIGIYRNWLTSRRGTFASSTTDFCTDIQRFTRNWFIVGNILRSPGFVNTDEGYYLGYPYGPFVSGTAQLSAADPWYDWDSGNNRTKSWAATLTTRTNDTSGVVTMASTAVADDIETSMAAAYGDGARASSFAGFVYLTNRVGDTFSIDNTSDNLPALSSAITIYPGVGGFRERDLDVEATATIRANYNNYTDSIPAGEAIGGDTFPDSLYLSSKPSWFGSISWPPIVPTSPPSAWDEATVTAMSPAAYRYYNGTEDYLTTPSTLTTTNASATNITLP